MVSMPFYALSLFMFSLISSILPLSFLSILISIDSYSIAGRLLVYILLSSSTEDFSCSFTRGLFLPLHFGLLLVFASVY